MATGHTLTQADFRLTVDLRQDNDGSVATALARDTLGIVVKQAFTNGTTATAAEMESFYHAQVNAATSSGTAVDLGALTDKFGNALDLQHLKVLVIRNKSATTSVTLGSNTVLFADATDLLNIPAGMTMAFVLPTSSYDMSGDQTFTLTSTGGGAVACDVVLAGIDT